jgi:hypothetical protein
MEKISFFNDGAHLRPWKARRMVPELPGRVDTCEKGCLSGCTLWQTLDTERGVEGEKDPITSNADRLGDQWATQKPIDSGGLVRRKRIGLLGWGKTHAVEKDEESSMIR